MTRQPDDATLSITLAPGAEEAGFPGMIAELIRGNLAVHPERRRDLDRIDGCVLIEALDAAVAVTLVFGRGALIVHAGIQGQPKVHLAADSSVVLELAKLEIVGGLPWLFGRQGRQMVGRLLRGQVRIRGLRHAATLLRLTRLLSVA